MSVLAVPRADEHAGSVLAGLAALRDASGWGFVQVSRPPPTAAFSRLDTLAPGYPAAAATARALGFTPVVRPAGGHLAAYDGGALVVDVLARHPDPPGGTERRFAALANALAEGLRSLGLDTRVGPVPGEYCPGRYSVNVGGRAKVAGTAQRIARGSVFVGAVVQVGDPEPVRAVLAAAYPLLGLAWAPDTVGCVSDHLPTATPDLVASAVLSALAGHLPLAPGPPRALGAGPIRVPLTACWDPR